MLVGEFEVNLGEKNRLAIPKKLRLNLKGEIYISKGFEDSLILIDETKLKSLIEKIETQSFFSTNSRDLKRYFLGSMLEIDADVQGRFVISEYLLEFASIRQKAIFIGVEDFVEIWSIEKWQEKNKYLNLNLGKILNGYT